MVTPIVMLLLMVAPSVGGRIQSCITGRPSDIRKASARGLGLLFIFTAIGHFTHTDSMVEMLPSNVLWRKLIVYVSGILEIAIAIGFLVRRFRRVSGCFAAVFLILVFPANIYAAIHQAPVGGHAWGPVYLLVRAPLQFIIFAWVWWFTIRPQSLDVPNHGAGKMKNGCVFLKVIRLLLRRPDNRTGHNQKMHL